MLDGVRILHYCNVAGLTLGGDKVVSLQLAGKSGVFSVRARAYVDATERGQLLSLAGLAQDSRASDGHMFSFYLNDVEDDAKLPSSLQHGRSKILLKPSAWRGELAVEFETTKGLHSGRQEIPGILEFLRREVPALGKAFMTHAAITELPLSHGGAPGKLSTGVGQPSST